MTLYIRSIAFAACLFLGACASVESHRQVSKGLSYERVVTEQGQIVHIATIDSTRHQLVLYKTPARELKSVSDIARTHHAIVAINGGFFAHNADAVGMLKINGTIISKPSKNRGVFGWSNQGQTFFDRLSNRPDGKGFSGAFEQEGWWNQADTIIGGTPLMMHNGQIIEVESEKTLTSFLTERYARTAVCVDKQNNIKLVVVNGGDRNTNKMGIVEGMSIAELAQFMRDQGCVHALNLDGGYSSSFVYDGVQQNSFSAPGFGERPVATMILVLPQK